MTTATLSTVFANFTSEMWCQGVMARDQYGNRCSVHDANAVQWCAFGWLMKSKPSLTTEARNVADAMGIFSIAVANDTLGWPYIEQLKDS